ncbi:MAG: L-aspartate oxidase [Myxococcales bacterium]|nr:MAG: L-aspartate oxidase [Myxococcales bacterium]
MADAILCDFLVLGSGIAALTFALKAAETGDVLVVTKREREESNTRYAQGGIAAVLDPSDTFEAHIEDTMVAGVDLSHRVVVEICVKEGPERVADLRRLGVQFTPADQPKEGHADLDLTIEGGHSARRVAHAQDMTGREVERALVAAASAHPRIQILEHHMAIDLITTESFGQPDRCVGAHVLDEKNATVKTVLGRATVLATGGAGKVYLYTTNPDVTTGDGIAMAYRAGAEVANMEFYQFHPTCLFHPQAKNFLISEALRGEGGILRLTDGTAFMKGHDPRGDLAPRDVVARTIDLEMKRTGSEHVLLDMTHKTPEFLNHHFPNILAECLRFGIDITTQPIPVVPAAHYLCGGVSTDLHGRTTLPGLWAIGECACTGLHGANRLASNSLLEGMVFGHRAARKLATLIDELRQEPWPAVPGWQSGDATPSHEAVIITQNWEELRRLMWNYVGIVRSNKRLERARRRIQVLQEEIQEYYWDHLVTRDLLELRNIATVAQLIVSCASARKESRGLHQTLDYPQTRTDVRQDTVLRRGFEARMRST